LIFNHEPNETREKNAAPSSIASGKSLGFEHAYIAASLKKPFRRSVKVLTLARWEMEKSLCFRWKIPSVFAPEKEGEDSL
jgi:hypothetical protein